MGKVKQTILLAALTLAYASSFSQDSIQQKETKTGWNFGALPTITYNSDLGLQYGALVNLFHYGDGSVYPEYYHSLYAEVSRFTKGSGIYRFFYDSKYLIPNIRLTTDLSYLPDQALDFYGFNGFQTVYNKNWEDDEHADYKSRMFYKHKRNIFRTKIDFQGKTGIKNINWAAGLNLLNYEVATVDLERLNKGKSDDEALPDIATLYDNYVSWGIIDPKEEKGGFFTSLKGGFVYDSRDNEPNPMKGIWSEAVLFQSFGEEYTFTKIALTHRQYFTLIKNNLSFAYRLGYQGIIAGTAPFYMLPYMVSSYSNSSNTDGLGGSKTVRGMIRNRVVGNSVAYGNMELRWKFTHFKWINQNFYLALNPFVDLGQVIDERPVDWNNIDFGTELASDYFNDGKDNVHITYGCGFRIAMNQNFIIAADVGFPADEQDGNMGIYIGLNYLF
jgi:hypothetical protein